MLIISILLVTALTFTSCAKEDLKINLTDDETIWLTENRGRISLLPCPDYPPIDFYDNKGKHSGLTAEYIKWIDERLNFSFKITPVREWSHALQKVKSREADGILSIQDTADRRKYLLFTAPYVTIPNIIVLRSSDSRSLSMEQMSGMSIAVVRGFAVTDFLMKKYPDYKFILYPNEISGIMDVSFARIDSMVVSLSTASYCIDNMGIANLRVAGSAGYNWNLCIATRSDMPLLNSILGKTLAAMPRETRMEINRRWISLGHGSLFQNKTFRAVFLSAAVSFALILIIILQWNRVLKRQTKQKTSDLVKELGERRRAEKELSDEKERLLVTLRSIGDAFFSADMGGRLVMMNIRAEDLTGVGSEEAMGKNFSSVCVLIDENFDNARLDPAELCIRNRSAIVLAEPITLLRPDGNKRSVTLGSSPIIDIDGEMTGVVVIIRDITDQALVRDELNKVQKLESLGILAGGIAHDFNNILTAIHGNSELIRHYLNSIGHDHVNLSVDPILGELERAVMRAKSLTTQLLTFSKGGKPIKKTGDISRLLIETVNFSLRGTHVKAEFEVDVPLRMVDFDEGQLAQVFNNLAINASQSMLSGGIITVSARNIANIKDQGIEKMGNFVMIRFADSGIGIAPEIISKIFDPFFTTKESGTGLGLTSSYSIITRHGGYILADLVQHKGSDFRIYLPVSKSGLSVEEKPLTAAVSAQKGKILLMDDDGAVRSMVTRMLSALGYQSDSAEMGEGAVELYKKSLEGGDPFQAVILDLTVPGGMGGIDTMRYLMQIDPYVKGIVSSGYSDTRAMSNFAEFGFSACLAKPFTMEELSAALQIILKKIETVADTNLKGVIHDEKMD